MQQNYGVFLIWDYSIFAICFIIFAALIKSYNMAILERKIIHERTTLCSRIVYPNFVLPRHKHAEYEIMLFTHGNGKQFVGEGVRNYKEGDVVMIGSNVPHLHLCNAKLNPDAGLEKSSGIALQFHPTIFPLSIDKLPDYLPIYELLQKSQYGIHFLDKNLYEELLQQFEELEKVEHTVRLIHLFQILERLCQCKKTNILSDIAYNSSNLLKETNEPVNRVYTYLFNHFKDKISLKEIADYVKQNPSALCRYFKQRTDKSIFQCLAEIRIEHACKLLAYSNLTVAQIAYESGYNFVPHFITQFEKITKRTPSEYRLQINV